MTLRNKLLIIIPLALLVLFIVIYNQQKGSPTNPSSTPTQPQVISTNPSPLDNGVVLPTQEIDISFSEPLVNSDEVKYQLDPPHQVKITLSEDKKTFKITPTTPYPIGSGFTLIISSNTKFQSGKSLNGDQVWHFRTPNYSGV